jgi:hypothetical protein
MRVVGQPGRLEHGYRTGHVAIVEVVGIQPGQLHEYR